MNKGFRGIWDQLTGRYGKQAHENEREALNGMRRDRREKDSLIERNIDERQSYHTIVKQVRSSHAQSVEQLHRDVADYVQIGRSERPDEDARHRDNIRIRGKNPAKLPKPKQRDLGRER